MQLDLAEGGRRLGYASDYVRQIINDPPQWMKRPLPYRKDHRGRWVVDEAELDAWAAEHGIALQVAS